MTEDQAHELASYLTARTPGWTNITATALKDDLLEFPYDVAAKALKTVARGWQARTRPPLGVIIDAITDERRALARDQPAVAAATTLDERIPTFDEGVAIAYRAYEAECRRQGRPANPTMFAKYVESLVPPGSRILHDAVRDPSEPTPSPFQGAVRDLRRRIEDEDF